MPRITTSPAPRHRYYAVPCFRAPEPERPDVEHFFARWCAALASGDAGAVADQYCDTAVLLPTATGTPRVGRAAIRDYFTHFPANRPQGRLVERHAQLGWDMAVDLGTYVFAFADGREVAARYTFVWRPVAGRWRITHHHSSAMPERFCEF